MPGRVESRLDLRRFVAYLMLFGLFLTVRGYRSREVDQAYRLPILLHQQDARLYADDPFVAAFGAFNPHRGYLALLDGFSRPLGLSAALAVLFGLTFLVTVAGLDRLGSAVWSDRAPGAGLVAAALAMVALAGNVGTNHLFEPMLLDRLIAFGLGWLALALAVEPEGRSAGSAAVIGLAALVHPSVGLQLAMLVGVGRLAWALPVTGTGERVGTSLRAIVLLWLAVLPGLALNLKGSHLLVHGLSAEDMRLLSAELQSPQHMLPHLWRSPQWLAWGCYPILAACALVAAGTGGTMPVARKRLLILLGVNLAGLALAWVGIEWVHHLRLTLFQPFRMATVARGLCLVLVAGHVRSLWESQGVTGRLRAVLIGVGLVGDGMLVAVTAYEVTMSVRDALARPGRAGWRAGRIAGFGVLAAGLAWLSRHDTESGHVPLLVAVVVGLGAGRFLAGVARPVTTRRRALRLAACWALPLAALAANALPEGGGQGLRRALVRRCRFAEVPIDDLERLAVWCRGHTPADARFIGPPGPKTFRLWSRRSLTFNRAGSPYHAAGLADWSRRFRDHVGFTGSNPDFVRAYLQDRHGLERRYDGLSVADKADLATRQGAGYVLAAAPKGEDEAGGPLVLLHREGRYAVYRVDRPRQVADRRR